MQGEGGLHRLSRRGLNQSCSYFESHKEGRTGETFGSKSDAYAPPAVTHPCLGLSKGRTPSAWLSFWWDSHYLVCLVLVSSVRERIKAITQTLQMRWCLQF